MSCWIVGFDRWNLTLHSLYTLWITFSWHHDDGLQKPSRDKSVLSIHCGSKHNTFKTFVETLVIVWEFHSSFHSPKRPFVCPGFHMTKVTWTRVAQDTFLCNKFLCNKFLCKPHSLRSYKCKILVKGVSDICNRRVDQFWLRKTVYWRRLVLLILNMRVSTTLYNSSHLFIYLLSYLFIQPGEPYKQVSGSIFLCFVLSISFSSGRGEGYIMKKNLCLLY